MTTRLQIAAVLLAACFALGSCTDDDGPISVAEFDALVEAAGQCDPFDQCVVVDTYCCSAGVTAERAPEVIDALERIIDAAFGLCAADCAASSELQAACVSGRCELSIKTSVAD